MSRVEEAWSRGNIAALLLMDVKGAFDHVSKKRLQRRMQEIGIDSNLISWVGSFLSDRKLQLVIDGHCEAERQVCTGVPQGSPVSPILFTIYLRGVFQKVENEVDTCQSTSFADDCGFLVEAPTVRELA